MPSLKAHCAISHQRTKFDFEDLHRWIDNPPEAKNLGPDHRIERHAYTVDEASYIKNYWEERKGIGWGEKAVIEWLFHIAIDNLSTAFKLSKTHYGEYTYNMIKIGITSSGFLNFDFNRANDYQLSTKLIRSQRKKYLKSDLVELKEYIEGNLEVKPPFQKAFVHKSYKNKLPHDKTNETLEMIGDKALDLVLYKHLYNESEGKITKEKMDRVRQEKTSKKGLAPIYDRYELQNYADFFDPKQPVNDEMKHNIVESLAGAIFLVEGYKMAEELLVKFILYPDTQLLF